MIEREEREKKILEILRNSETLVSGTYLAEFFDVSRQVIVQDIAILKAKNIDIISTNRGYRLLSKGIKKIIKVKHDDSEIRNELNAIVDLGASVEDVFVIHKTYGEIRVKLDIKSRRDVDLLVEKDYNIALRKAKHIDEYNEQRKDIDKQMTEEANVIVAKLESQKYHSSIVLYDENWKKGVIGIVASRLTEIYFRPTVVLTRDGDLATGSARSVTGFDVYAAIKHCRDLLMNFGGHTYAAGLTLRWDDIPLFRKRFQQYVEDHIAPEQTEATIHLDAQLDFKDITKKLYNDLKRFAPFGPECTKPLFFTQGVYDYGTSKVVGREQEHIKLELVDSKSSNVVNGIAFGQSASARYIKSKRSFDIAYTIEANVFKHNQVQLQIEDIRPGEEHESKGLVTEEE